VPNPNPKVPSLDYHNRLEVHSCTNIIFLDWKLSCYNVHKFVLIGYIR